MEKSTVRAPTMGGEAATGGRVFVVDDDERILKFSQELLTHRGYTVEVCSDSTKVIPRIKAEVFDVLLLDIRMPGIEGTDLLPLLKKIRPELPVIVVSAYSSDADRNYYHSLGAFAVLGKPFSNEVLLDTVNQATRRQEHIPLILTSFSLQAGKEQLYRKLILAALQKTDWSQVKAAQLLGVSRYCVLRWMKRLGLSNN